MAAAATAYVGARGRRTGQVEASGRDQLADIQRARILSAMFDVACERGAANVTIANVVERSGVSRRTFYETFVDREECFLAALEEALRHVSLRVLPAYRSSGSWRERIRAALVELLTLLDEEPLLARLLVVESVAAGPRAQIRRHELLELAIAAVDEGREAQEGSDAPPLAAEGVVGGAVSVIHSRLLSAEPGRLVELTGALMSMIVLPYMGTGAARRELARSLPTATGHEHDPALLSDPFKRAGMRLTYRTVRVLMAVADNPSASNRVIGDAAEIKDQGQISKLLARLERAVLVSNSGMGPGQGAPNAWTLTGAGDRVVRGIRAHVPGEEGS